MAPLKNLIALWLVAAFCLAGCGGDQANLVVRIESIAGDNPFDGVGVLRLTVEHERPGQVEYVGVMPSGQESIGLPDLSLNGSVRVLVDGFADDTLTLLLAAGTTPWVTPKGGHTTEAVACFCKVATIEAGQCACPEGG